MQKAEITINKVVFEATREAFKPPENFITEAVRYKFYHAGEYVGGFTRQTHEYESVLYKDGIRIAWDMVKGMERKFNRYYLEKMGRLTDEALKENSSESSDIVENYLKK